MSSAPSDLHSAAGPAPLVRAGGYAWLWLLPVVGYYAFLLRAGSGGLLSPVPFGLTFNSMLSHLVHGRFDVDPAAIEIEGYVRNGLTYSYFGIFPALFRLLFLPLPQFATTDLTRIGCLTAVSLMALFKVLSVQLVGRWTGAKRAPIVQAALIVAILLGGAQTQFLRPSIYQEVLLWAGACAALFVYLFVRGWLGEAGFTPRLMTGMAIAAGLCLLTRVSTALGLYLALGLLWLALVWRQWRSGARMPALAAYAAPMLVAVGFAVIAGAINRERWGNPLVFADLTRALILDRFPERVARLHEYGEFNLVRLPFGLQYYFCPVWVLRGAGGDLWWGAFQARALDAVELPPASFFITDPLTLGLAAYGIARLLRGGGLPDRGLVGVALAGLFVPIGLILIAISMTFRYRLEFYPFFELAAFVGFGRLAAAAGIRTRVLVLGAAVWSVAAAQAAWVVYMLSPFGPAAAIMGGQDLIGFYSSLLR